MMPSYLKALTGASAWGTGEIHQHMMGVGESTLSPCSRDRYTKPFPQRFASSPIQGGVKLVSGVTVTMTLATLGMPGMVTGNIGTLGTLGMVTGNVGTLGTPGMVTGRVEVGSVHENALQSVGLQDFRTPAHFSCTST